MAARSSIRIAATDAEIERCSPVMRQLRPHIAEQDFLPRIRLQEREGYRLAYLEHEGEIVAAAGFRVIENLSAGRVLYVDDLVTDAEHRSQGHGATLVRWLVDRARLEGCAKLDLDSGVHRKDAHRFYLAQGMTAHAHHFRFELTEPNH